jgi:hypothetical protein
MLAWGELSANPFAIVMVATSATSATGSQPLLYPRVGILSFSHSIATFPFKSASAASQPQPFHLQHELRDVVIVEVVAGELILTTEVGGSAEHCRACRTMVCYRRAVIYDAFACTRRALDNSSSTTLVGLRCPAFCAAARWL